MRPDRILAGKYRLVSKLTEGGMGMVWRAEHVELGTPAAVKLLDPTIAQSSDALARFRREAQSAASLRSSNVVQIFDFGVDGDLPYIAMELLEGESLADRLRAERVLPPDQTATILSQVARATSWAHSRGIVHRDLKPANIFLSEDAGNIVVKLLDFGIAKPSQLEVSESLITLTGTIMGTPQYMSPEQAAGMRELDHRTDIWSFAIIAFECLTGRHAFHANTLGGLVLAICAEPLPIPSNCGEVPAGFDEWFARAAHRSLDERFSSIARAAEQLRLVCGVETPPSGHTYPYDSTLQSDSRATPDVNAPRTTSSPSITALVPESSIRPRRRRAYWVSGGLLAAGVAMGVGGRTHYNQSSATSALGSAVATASPSAAIPPTEPAGPVVTLVADQPDLAASGTAAARVPMGIPMGGGSSGASQTVKRPRGLPKHPTIAAEPYTMASAAQPRAIAPRAQCDPSVKNRIGICPAAAR